jgi:hypothetical protein
VSLRKHPCARGIANAWHTFRNKLYENDGNLYSASLFSNPGIRNRMNDMVGGGNIFSRGRYELIQEQIWEIPLGVFCLEEGIRSKTEVEHILDINITNLEYNKLKGTIKYMRNKFKPVWEMRSKGKSITQWLAPIKKGSNKIRNIMSGRGSREYRNFTFEKIKPIKSLWEKMEIELDEVLIHYSMMVWDTKEVDTEFRQYAFRWYQGMIHGNTVIAHFGDVDRKCTFCKIRLERELAQRLGRDVTIAEREGMIVPDEDRPHIFWNCSTVSNCVQAVHRSFWDTNNDVGKKDFLLGKDMDTVEATVLYMLINMFIKFRIWKYKLAGVMPVTQNIIQDLRQWTQNLKAHNKWRNMLLLLRQHIPA